MKQRYTPEMLEFLGRGYKHMTSRLLTRAFNKRFNTSLSVSAVKSTLAREGINSGRATGSPAGTSWLFDIEHIRFIKRAYVKMPAKLVCQEMNRWFGTDFKPQQVITFVHNHGIDSGRTGQFEKGQVSWNKGRRFEAGGRSAETRFKKGHMPAATVPVGTEVLTKDGYIKVKVSEGGEPGESRFNWKLLHRKVWEEHHGPVPDGHAVSFRDGNRQNCALENLVLLSRNELRYLNKHGLTMAELPPELRKTARALARTESKRFERIKELQK